MAEVVEAGARFVNVYLARSIGGLGKISNCTRLVQPWRIEVSSGPRPFLADHLGSLLVLVGGRLDRVGWIVRRHPELLGQIPG